MTHVPSAALVFRDTAGEYFLVPQELLEQGQDPEDLLERGRVPQQRNAAVEQLLADANAGAGADVVGHTIATAPAGLVNAVNIGAMYVQAYIVYAARVMYADIHAHDHDLQ